MNASNSPPPYLQDRYRLEQWLGEGSMGVVYRAHDEALNRLVAIKFLSPRRLGQGEALVRFEREARTAARLSHPNIMGLFDAGQAEGWHYLVMEYVPGKDLAATLAESPVGVDTAVATAVSILKALEYAHEQGVIHRDIKPENIMIAANGQVKVMDFGIALSLDETRLTQEKGVVGTVQYLSSEQLQGKQATVQTDLYAAGAVLYEMLTRRPPFVGDSLAVILVHILNNPPLPPRLVNPAIPVAIEQVVLKLLAKEASNRYLTAQAAIDALTHSTEHPSTAPLSAMVGVEMADALEAERRRLANLVGHHVVGPLNLLLAQVSAYEQSVANNPTAQMAVSVLGVLARQIQQQARDLEANLHPTTLTSLGLEAALEGLANQVVRQSGAQVDVQLTRMEERLSAPLELALFRAAQDGVEAAITQGRATRLTIALSHNTDQIVFQITTDSQMIVEPSPVVAQRLIQLGAHLTNALGKLTIQFNVSPDTELTARELETLQLVAYGLSNKEIAQRLSVKPRTVNFHLDNVYTKLGVNSRTEAAICALRQGWIRSAQE